MTGAPVDRPNPAPGGHQIDPDRFRTGSTTLNERNSSFVSSRRRFETRWKSNTFCRRHQLEKRTVHVKIGERCLSGNFVSRDQIVTGLRRGYSYSKTESSVTVEEYHHASSNNTNSNLQILTVMPENDLFQRKMVLSKYRTLITFYTVVNVKSFILQLISEHWLLLIPPFVSILRSPYSF